MLSDSCKKIHSYVQLRLDIKFMPSYSFRFFLLIFILGLSACGRLQFSDTAPKIENGQINLADWSFESNGQIRLDGEWEVYWDELIPPDQINLDIPIAEREHQYVPALWGDGARAVTLRLEIELGDLDEALGFYQSAPVPTGASKYFWNGVEFYALGDVHTSLDEASYRTHPFATDLPARPGLNELVIQIIGVPYHKASFMRAPVIGEKEKLFDVQASMLSAKSFLLGGLLLIAAFQFSLFISRPSDLSGLYTALICITTAIWVTAEGLPVRGQSLEWISWHVRVKIEYLAIYSLAPLGFLVLDSLYPIKIWRWVKVLILGLPFLFSLAALSLPSGYVVVAWLYFLPASTLALAANFFIAFYAVLRRYNESLLVFASLLVIAFAAFYDVRLLSVRAGALSNTVPLPLMFSIPYAVLLFAFVQSYAFTLKWSRLNIEKTLIEQVGKNWSEILLSFEGAPMGIVITDEAGVIQNCNKAFYRIFGYDNSELPGTDVSVLWPDIKDLIRNDYIENYKSGRPSQLIQETREFEVNRSNGAPIHVELTLSRFRANDKHLFIGMIQDITKRKEQRDAFQKIFENSPIAMAIKPYKSGPLPYIYLAANAAASELVGLSIKRILELDETIFYYQEDVERFQTEIESRGAVYSVDTKVKHFESGGFRDVLVSFTPAVYEGVPALIISAVDITDRKEAEASLRRSKKEAEAYSLIAKTTLDNMDQGFMHTDASFSNITLNNRLLEYLNIPKDSVPPILNAEQLRALTLKGGQLTEIDFEKSAKSLQNPDRTSYSYITSAGLTLDVRQVPIEGGGFVRTYTDITQRKFTEAFLGEVLSHTPDGVITIDLNGIVKTANAATERLFGFMADELIGKNIEVIVPNEITKHHGQNLTNYKRTGETPFIGANREVEGKRKDGSIFPLEIVTSKFSIGGEINFTGIVRDITERKKTEESLRQLARDAEAATESKATFLASMSHEIRTPMNGVVGMVDLLLQTKLDDEQTRMLNIARDSGKSLLTIIDDILDFSKVEAGKMELEAVESSIAELVEVSAQSLIPNAFKYSAHIITYIDPALPEKLLADPVRVRQILTNLGGNAIKFSESGEVFIKAEFAEQQGETGKTTVRFSVIDQGIGISDEAQKNLFEDFNQADLSTTRKYGGTGLGLSITKRLTELMGGVIGVRSILGEGSTFFCDIPFSQLAKPEPEVNRKRFAGLRMLLVCPSRNYEFVCNSYLSHWGAEVISTTNMRHSVELARRAITQNKAFDVVVVLAPNLDNEILALCEAFAAAELVTNPRFVVGRGRRKNDSLLRDMKEVTTVSITPLQRAELLTVVAKAAGLDSPEEQYSHEIVEIEGRRAPTLREALRQNKLILLAEDNPTNQEVLRRQLAFLGYACEIANDGKEAYAMWCKQTYALLLTDCHMPEWDGFELTKAVRKHDDSTGRRTPIIAITANALKGEAEKCIEKGMDDYLSKPVEMDALQKTLHKWMAVGGTAKEEIPMNDDNPQSTATVSQAATSNIGTIDPQALEELFGEDPKAISEILQSYVDSTEAIISEVKDGWDNRSVISVSMAAHKLKSSSRTVGAHDLADICQAIEAAGNENDLDAICKLIPKLEPLFRLIQVYVNGRTKD